MVLKIRVIKLGSCSWLCSVAVCPCLQSERLYFLYLKLSCAEKFTLLETAVVPVWPWKLPCTCRGALSFLCCIAVHTETRIHSRALEQMFLTLFARDEGSHMYLLFSLPWHTHMFAYTYTSLKWVAVFLLSLVLHTRFVPARQLVTCPISTTWMHCFAFHLTFLMCIVSHKKDGRICTV